MIKRVKKNVQPSGNLLIPEDVLRMDMDFLDKAIYAKIQSFSKRGKVFFGSLEYLMALVDKSENTIRRIMKRLMKADLVRKTTIVKGDFAYDAYYTTDCAELFSCSADSVLATENSKMEKVSANLELPSIIENSKSNFKSSDGATDQKQNSCNHDFAIKADKSSFHTTSEIIETICANPEDAERKECIIPDNMKNKQDIEIALNYIAKTDEIPDEEERNFTETSIKQIAEVVSTGQVTRTKTERPEILIAKLNRIIQEYGFLKWLAEFRTQFLSKISSSIRNKTAYLKASLINFMDEYRIQGTGSTADSYRGKKGRRGKFIDSGVCFDDGTPINLLNRNGRTRTKYELEEIAECSKYLELVN